MVSCSNATEYGSPFKEFSALRADRWRTASPGVTACARKHYELRIIEKDGSSLLCYVLTNYVVVLQARGRSAKKGNSLTHPTSYRLGPGLERATEETCLLCSQLRRNVRCSWCSDGALKRVWWKWQVREYELIHHQEGMTRVVWLRDNPSAVNQSGAIVLPGYVTSVSRLGFRRATKLELCVGLPLFWALGGRLGHSQLHEDLLVHMQGETPNSGPCL